MTYFWIWLIKFNKIYYYKNRIVIPEFISYRVNNTFIFCKVYSELSYYVEMSPKSIILEDLKFKIKKNLYKLQELIYLINM